MTCPKCSAQMRQYERNSVVIDQCTECRGIFLDRGELDKLIDAENAWHRATPPPSPLPPQPQPAPYQPQRPYRDYDSDEYPRYGQPGYGRKRRRGGFLGELFD